MPRFIVAALLLAAPVLAPAVLAQDDAAKARMAAGCGPDSVMYKVKTDKKHHPTGQPAQGKALVYVFGDTTLDNGSNIGTLTTRIGVDSAWVGANKFKSYFFFLVDPGEHRICSSIQERNNPAWSAAETFTAEAGKVYYFRTKDPSHPNAGKEVDLSPVDPAEAQLLIAASAFSTFQVKK